MALKESNKNRKKETDQDVEDLQNMWKPIPKIHKET